MQTAKTLNIVALDVGDKRVGIAATNTLARLPRPVVTLVRDDNFWDSLDKIIREELADTLVVGMPTALNGNRTEQTTATEEFVRQLQERTSLPIITHDETLTSHQAEAELNARGKRFEKGDIDALAAVFILEDYLRGEA